ncbi:hypothetical protein P152DRAFT_195076 [Eremomyces bilateralis CBS 781.70]|uniref:Uncharacterized protein n=1 Tax=Eremomyces bilateralis CBS 781.70 TaxID=1392243 RepID=A0A6G1GCZ8_9PEZI|nr:uncharacterized protein P152DRAFT_195076 [Eremomyces bilateralis CBS 781.70]KAF1815739.1 hypothetical protein P152DRAFT_195076 [Eremomyces bilateralis CBS 781.70]
MGDHHNEDDKTLPQVGINPTIKSIAAFGACAGVFGGLTAGTVGVLRGIPHPGLRVIAGGLSYFFWGSTLWTLRSAGLAASSTLRGPENVTSTDRVLWTTVAAGISGGCSGLMQERFGGQKGTLRPTIFLWTIAALGGQSMVEFLDSRHQQRLLDEELDPRLRLPMLHRLAASKWSPFKLLSNEEYEQHLEERILVFDTEIALIDDQIAQLKLALSAEESSENQRS